VADEIKDLVECHSEYEYAERPIALHWESQRLVIAEVEDAWRIPGAKCFRVRVEDGRRFELFYGEMYDEWRVNLI
jgi:hypothetical protein